MGLQNLFAAPFFYAYIVHKMIKNTCVFPNIIYNKIRLKCEKVCRKGDAICFHQIYIVMWMY